MSAVRFWWVRHAPTGRRGAYGWTDVAADLSDHAALDRLAAALPAAPVLSSDLARARATADRIARGRPRLPDDPAIRELHFGEWEGLGFDAIAERWPDAHRAFWTPPGAAPAPGGESLEALCARVDAAIDRLAAEVGAGDVVLVAHMGAIMAALRRALALTPAAATAFAIDPLSVTRLDWLPEPGAWRVAAVNRPP
jgi:broad specificity phosphatase PhoE